jgi:hypothetical protein
MKFLFLCFLFYSSLTCADQTATTEDGRKVILKDDGTWIYAPEAKDKKAVANEYSNAETIIKKKCAQDWPDDFSTRAFCEKQQREAVEKLKKGKPNDITDDEYLTLHGKCARDWPEDFSTRAFCEQQQVEAIRELRKQ